MTFLVRFNRSFAKLLKRRCYIIMAYNAPFIRHIGIIGNNSNGETVEMDQRGALPNHVVIMMIQQYYC